MIRIESLKKKWKNWIVADSISKCYVKAINKNFSIKQELEHASIILL